MSAAARSRTAACRISKTARHPAMAASRTRSRVAKSGSLASHWDKTSVPLWGSIAQGRHTAFLPCCDDSSCRLRSTRVVSVVPPAYPAEQAHRTSLRGIPPSMSAAEAALIAAHRRPPSSASSTTCTRIRDFGYRCRRIVASSARLRRWEISINRRSVLGFVSRRSPPAGAKGAALTETSTTARSGSSSDRLRQAMGPLTVARATVSPISTSALPPTASAPLAVVEEGPSWTRIRRISPGLRPSFRRFDRAKRSVRRIEEPMVGGAVR
mmetsp:Transcript_109505/g.223817  ORF Transcript_109505/g.223817 Transcript_109505/m.223817 type:complete len:268 (-) Transcript_109505:237-1040(-)